MHSLGEPLKEDYRWDQSATHGTMYEYVSWDVSEQVGVYLSVEGIVTDDISFFTKESCKEYIYDVNYVGVWKNFVEKIKDFVRMRLQWLS